MDLHMLTLMNGRERTRAEFERLLADSGFQLRRALPTQGPSGITILDARAC